MVSNIRILWSVFISLGNCKNPSSKMTLAKDIVILYEPSVKPSRID